MNVVELFDFVSASLGVIAFGITTFNFYYIAAQIKAEEQVEGLSDEQLYIEYVRVFCILKSFFWIFVALCGLCSYYMIISAVAPNYPELTWLWRFINRPFIVILALVTIHVCRNTQLGKRN